MNDRQNTKRKSPLYVSGTKSISPQADDPLYDSLQHRIERNKSVALWSYRKKDNMAHIKIMFTDSDIILDVKVDSLNIVEVQKAVSKIDDYFVLKQQRN